MKFYQYIWPWQENDKLNEKNNELKKKLQFYENPHTPPSVTTLKTTDKKSKDQKSNVNSTPKKQEYFSK